jgi:small nuclear ribonucleoprotein (snRNP)-like protein
VDSLPPPATPDLFHALVGRIVVVDTDSSFVYLGRLESTDAQFLILSEVDVHEVQDAGLSKERYVHESHGLGVRANRKRTWVRLARVVSISPLEDVISF